MITSALILLCLAAYGATTFSYQKVATCSGMAGDSAFTASKWENGVKVIHAVNTRRDEKTDRCITRNQGTYYVTREDSSLGIYKFSSTYQEGSGSFTEIGADGNEYQLIVMKSYGPECGNMDLVLRCSDNVGNDRWPNVLEIYRDENVDVPNECIEDAREYAKDNLYFRYHFSVLPNSGCYPYQDICKKD